MIIPKLTKSTRKREFLSYTHEQRSRVVYEFLFKNKTHRELDRSVLQLTDHDSRGYQSMGILHYLGLKGEFRGLFNETSLEEAIDCLNQADSVEYAEIIKLLEFRLRAEKQVSLDTELETNQDFIVSKDGAKHTYLTTRYERNLTNRMQAIKCHGTKCMACGFDFLEFYGERGRDYIEVHHVVPLSTLDEAVDVNPHTDLIVVCANCHRMIHRKRNEPLTLEQLKALINRKTTHS